MKWINIIILSSTVWLLQLLLSDSLSISSVRPDFCAILILYWSLIYGSTFGICSGFLLGLIVDLSGSGIFFGLSPLTYTITGYLGGGLGKNHTKLNPFYTSLSWIVILFFHFLVYCLVQYQDLWELNRKIFWGKWFGTAIYTISFAGVLQFIYPIKNLLNAKSR
jgi:rod shape-determining protein MreD